MESDYLAACLRLQLTPGVGSVAARKLLTEFKTPPSIFAQNAATLARVVNAKQSQALLQEPENFAQHKRELEQWLLASAQNKVWVWGDEDYPAAFLQMEDPPWVLYVQCGDFAWWRNRLAIATPPCLAIVGSRSPTPQGERNAEQFTKSLIAAGYDIVSGMALGIDAAAHTAALDAGGKTIAVVGTGLDRVYPRQHHALAHRIAAQGAIISEFPLGTGPMASNFPKRNRLIAGLSRGTLVVEANVQSGSLITARLALEQNKEVFAIPGSIHAPQAKGCHALIKQGAKLVESLEDIVQELPSLQPIVENSLTIESTITPIAGASGDTQADAALLKIMGYDPITLDELIARSGYSGAQLQLQLLELEMAGRVQRLVGAQWQIMARA